MFSYRITFDGSLRDLAMIEFLSLINTYGASVNMQEIKYKTFLVDSNIPLEAIFLRSALITRAERILGSDPWNIDWNKLFNSFSTDSNNIALTYRIEKIEPNCKIGIKDIDAAIRSTIPNVKVSMTYPQIVLCVRKIQKHDFICQPLKTGRDYCLERQLKYRPYAPSAAMDSLLSRALVNLSHLLPSEIFLDPFCGTGSLLIEAAFMGLKTFGSDINPQHVRASRMLLEYYNVQATVRIADARDLPFEDNFIDGIATDPPYGLSSSTYGEPLYRLYEKFLVEGYRVLKDSRFLVTCFTPNIPVTELAKSIGFEVLDVITMRVHSKLTRLIGILRS